MSALRIKTAAEQKLEWLESLSRPLTDRESDELRRSLHAVYCRNRRLRVEAEANAAAIAEIDQAERATLDRMMAEASR